MTWTPIASGHAKLARRSWRSRKRPTTATTTGATAVIAWWIPKATTGGSCNACANKISVPDLDRTLAALGDPQRRAIVELLREQALCPSELADALSMSRPAMSRHLRILRGAGLVEHE